MIRTLGNRVILGNIRVYTVIGFIGLYRVRKVLLAQDFEFRI